MEEEGEGEGVILLGVWVSTFNMRVRIALAEKGVNYEFREQDLFHKSPLFLESNPVHKKIPVLLHRSKPVCESLNIVQYIDEAWPDRAPFFPSDAYERSQARFWADFIDKKVHDAGMRLWTEKGSRKEEAKEELLRNTRMLEDQLGDELYFGGYTFGYLDIAFVPFTSWFYAYEMYGRFGMEEECPKVVAWARRCAERESVAKTLPDGKKVFEYIKMRFGF